MVSDSGIPGFLKTATARALGIKEEEQVMKKSRNQKVGDDIFTQ
jgi:hypothetical protein